MYSIWLSDSIDSCQSANRRMQICNLNLIACGGMPLEIDQDVGVSDSEILRLESTYHDKLVH